MLNRYFFSALGFRPEAVLDSADSLLPDPVLQFRRGHCVGLATVYLAFTRNLDLPVAAVATPSHLFVRYDDGRERFNIELTESGATYEDAWYAREYSIPPSSIANGVFLRSLSDRELLGYVYTNLGALYSRVGDFAGSRRLYEDALRKSPLLPAAHYNLGNDFLYLGLHRDAIRRFDKALRLYPTDVWALNNRGRAFCGLGKIRRARRDFKKALALEPSFTLAAQNLANPLCGSAGALAD